MSFEESPIAVCVTVVNPDAALDAVLHDAVLLAGRIATPIFVKHGGDYLIHPYDNCPEDCPQCADRNPNLKPQHRDLRWNPRA